MKTFKNLLILAFLTASMVFISCGKDGGGDDEPTQRELILEALSGSWAIDGSASNFANTGLDGSTTEATFSATGFTLTGGVADYSSGGSYVISETGTFTEVDVTVVSSDLQLEAGTASVSINAALNQVTVSFTTSEASTGRVGGLGSFNLLFNQ